MSKEQTVSFYFRGDIRDIATILRYYKKTDRHPNSRSKMLGLVVSDLATILTEAGEVTPCTSSEEAFEETTHYFDASFTPTKRFVDKVKDERILESLGGRVEQTVEADVDDIIGALNDDLD